MPPRHAARGVKKSNQVTNEARRQAQQTARESRQRDAEGQVNSWFERHDANHDNKLDEAEFKPLLSEILKVEVDDAFVKKLMEECNNEITKDNVKPLIVKYKAYLKDREAFDKFFAEHDKNNDGSISKDEMLPILQACAKMIDVDPPIVVGATLPH